MNEYVPFKRNSKKRKGRILMCEEIQSMIKQKHKLWFKIRSEKDKIDYEKMKEERELASKAKHD